ncbi:type IV toxin-antitoxin system AbiEi family antitoxin [Legionella cincinnatiensis]|uniref:Ynd n=1 Tax=Legionella cincinnatiensis TaxID=28085 RepID=A0A378IXL9_9GAMM|nr:type IV toxin-antitoxin system AbiEi family antitoxin [Legionella cincinnatiensis]KTC83352.1 hypothetical protein Lcin_2724 [Legionella cincinnatiensis]STX36744.1 Ynd [Legionella cincinnatiensis]
MTRKNETKLNHFLVNAPSGEVLTSDWLESHGVSSKLAWWYVHTGLLENLGAKAYKKTGDKIGWAGVVSALQNQLSLPVHIGGKTALQLLGLAHFMMMQASNRVELFAPLGIKLPKWMKNTKWNTEFSMVRTSIFNDPDNQLGIIKQTIDGKELQLSCPERAAMELLYLYPQSESFDEVVYLMENLNQLRPKVVQTLLESCSSVKVKRLFLHLAEEFNHPWVSALDLNKIDLGQGKRVMETGGKYYPKYKISLPEIKEQ